MSVNKLLTAYLLLAFLMLLSGGLTAQESIRAKAISYQVTVELGLLDPVYYYQTDSDTTEVLMEIDLYYDKVNVRTVPRIIRKPNDSDFRPHTLLYTQRTNRESVVDDVQKLILETNNTNVTYRKTREKKNILGYKCQGLFFTDSRNVRVLAYVATKLKDNISPWGNCGLDGTVLELLTSNGYHFVATDFAEGELPPDFFDLPDYQIKTFLPSAGH